MGVTSCSLDLIPLNEVVLENFWTDKNDVESVVASCYQAMREGSYISNMIVWGEGRSDNTDIGTGDKIPEALISLMQGRLKTTNSYCDWSSMYNVINRCNTVIYYAPQVAEKDPNYTPSDLNITIAECSFLRAYSYLTLIKTFKNVPFSFEPSIDDTKDFCIPQTSFEEILDALIADINSCKDYAPRKYSDADYNTGKITRAAMYSLLAELYLWKASDYNLPAEEKREYYTRCIEACDWVLNFKRQQFQNKDTNGDNITDKVDDVWTLFGYPLLSEKVFYAQSPTTGIYVPNGFYSNFSECHSFETIFEIPFMSKYDESNDAVADMYGVSPLNATVKRHMKASRQLMSKYPETNQTTYNNDNNTLFSIGTDYRSLLSFIWNSDQPFDICKYVVLMPGCKYAGSGIITEAAYKGQADNGYLYPRTEKMHTESWIIYRLPEIMLFRAEAEIELAALIDAAATPTKWDMHPYAYREGTTLVGSASDLYADAYNLITAVYVRSNPAAATSNDVTTYAPQLSQFNNVAAFETYLMNERRRELLFEGKRYYDLVRQARREGNTEKFSSTLSNKFSNGAGSLQLKMKMMDFMYMPVLKSQMQLNPNLVQNPAYAEEDEIVKN